MSSEALKKAQEALRIKREMGIPLVRLDPIEKSKKNPSSLRLAINGKCWDCSGGQKEEIKMCNIPDCTLWAVRPYQNKTDDEV